jgi:hypothetical protein
MRANPVVLVHHENTLHGNRYSQMLTSGRSGYLQGLKQEAAWRLAENLTRILARSDGILVGTVSA